MSSLMIALLLSGLAPTDYWVDISHGDNSFEGTEERPFKNLFHALSVATDGDRIWVRPGNYSQFTGESFPLDVPAGVSVISTDGPESTRIIGDGTNTIFQCLGHPAAGIPTVIEGLTIRSGGTGVGTDGSGVSVTLLNNTITTNTGGGFSLATDQGRIEVLYNRIEWNMRGSSITSPRRGWPPALSRGNRFDRNRVGLTVRSRWEGGVISENDVFSDNRQWGFDCGHVLEREGYAILRNGTITGNGYGGVRVTAGRFSFYIPGVGYFYEDLYGSIHIEDSLIVANSQNGVIEAGDEYLDPIGTLKSSIVWGNGFDNTGFEDSNSIIGTSDTPLGPGSFSADPRFVDPENGDYRLRPDSPCIDHHPTLLESLDFEGELVPFDGDGDGIALKDVGPDEFHTFVYPGQRPVAGKPFHFEVAGDPSDEGNLAWILISASRAEASGIPLPGDPRRVDLEPGPLFDLGLSLATILTTPIKDRRGRTASVLLPAQAFQLDEIVYAGVTIDLATGQIGAVFPAHELPLR